jgi:hypothetical protein
MTPITPMPQASAKTFTGGCHCGKVRYEVSLDLSKGVSRCNCTICQKLGRTGVIVKPDAFRLLAGDAELHDYQWGGRIGHHLFCRHCGVHAFGRGHLDVLGGDYVSINANCLDDVEPIDLPVQHWDGRHNNWQAGARAKPWPIQASGPSS